MRPKEVLMGWMGMFPLVVVKSGASRGTSKGVVV